MSNDTLARNDLFSAMEQDQPYASYIKTILGKVIVTVWDNFLNKPMEVILYGDPATKGADCIVNVYSPREDAFFRRVNDSRFKKGLIIPYKQPEQVEEPKLIEQASDEEIIDIVNSKYFSLLKKLAEIQSVPVLFRMLRAAEDLNKSEKITTAIKSRISELQVAEFPQKLDVEINVPREE